VSRSTPSTASPTAPALTHPSADHAVIPALRAALDTDDPQPAGPPLTTAQLRDRLDHCEQDRAAARYRELGTALPELLIHSHALAARADTAIAAGLLTDTFLLAQTVAYRFGYLDLAALANYLARHAAHHAEDPLRVAIAANQRALLRLHRGDYFGVQVLLERAHAHLADQKSPAADAVRVALHLREALAAARLANTNQAHAHLTSARALIGSGLPANPYCTVTATETTLDVHTLAVAVELGDPATALAHAEQIKIPTGESPARLGHYWIALARAWTLHGDHPHALHALHQARQIAPQLTRYHPQAREIMHFLVEHDRRATDSLADFARWAGITL